MSVSTIAVSEDSTCYMLAADECHLGCYCMAFFEQISLSAARIVRQLTLF